MDKYPHVLVVPSQTDIHCRQSHGGSGETMSKATESDDRLDSRTAGAAKQGVSAARKIELASYGAPLHVLQQYGIEVPHRTFNPEGSYTYPTTQTFDDGTKVHLHQNVREQNDGAFGSFGAAKDDAEDVTWTVVDLCDGSVTITVVGDWSKRRNVPFEDFPDEYEPIYLTNGEPQWGY